MCQGTNHPFARNIPGTREELTAMDLQLDEDWQKMVDAVNRGGGTVDGQAMRPGPRAQRYVRTRVGT